jgi:hypothetical protein
MTSGFRVPPVALLAAVVLAACTTISSTDPTLPALPSTVSTAEPGPSRVPARTPDQSPTTYRLSEIGLPQHTIADVTVVCDPYQYTRNETVCEDVIRYAIPAVALATDDPLQRVYLRRGCAPSCGRGERDVETIVAATEGAVWTMIIDNDSITEPVPDPSAVWPQASGTPSPSVHRRSFSGEPTEIRDREAYPFCGPELGDWVAVTGCFLDAVLEGRPAEMIELTHPIDFGSPALLLTRFDGDGAVRQYLRRDKDWFRLDGSVVMREPGGCAFEQWGDAVRVR